MSLIKWRELAKQKSMLGNKINFVYDTLTKAKLGEETSQLAYEKIFRPITSKMDVASLVPNQHQYLRKSHRV